MWNCALIKNPDAGSERVSAPMTENAVELEVVWGSDVVWSRASCGTVWCGSTMAGVNGFEVLCSTTLWET